MAKGLRKPIARSTHTKADTLCPSHAPAAIAPYYRRRGVYSGGGHERGGGVKSRWRKDIRLGQRGQPREHDGGMAPGATATREAPAAEPGAGVAGVRKAIPRHHRFPPGRPTSVASTAAVAAAAVIPAVTAVAATTAGTFPRSWGDLRGTWRFLASSPHCKADARGPSRGV